MRSPRRSPLFSAIVLAGASLTAGEAACGGDSDPKDPSGGDASTSTGADANGSASDAAGSTGDTGGGTTEADATSDACPPGSEIPIPPCVLIK